MVLSSTLPSHAIPTPARPTTGSTTPVYPLGKVKTVRSRCSRIARARQIESSFGGLPLRSPVYRRSCWGAPHQWTARPIRLVRNFSGAPIDKAFVIFFSLPNPRLVFFFFFPSLLPQSKLHTNQHLERERTHQHHPASRLNVHQPRGSATAPCFFWIGPFSNRADERSPLYLHFSGTLVRPDWGRAPWTPPCSCLLCPFFSFFYPCARLHGVSGMPFWSFPSPSLGSGSFALGISAGQVLMCLRLRTTSQVCSPSGQLDSPLRTDKIL